MIDRPPIGYPCNGCGLCCRTNVCLTGSKALGLVDTLGQRAPGPCPALVKSDDAGWRCGLVNTPTKWINNGLGVTRLREAVKLLIGAGIGCDEYDESDPLADEKLAKLRNDYMARRSMTDIARASRDVFGGGGK